MAAVHCEVLPAHSSTPYCDRSTSLRARYIKPALLTAINALNAPLRVQPVGPGSLRVSSFFLEPSLLAQLSARQGALGYLQI